MTGKVSIETADATLAALLMRETVGRMRARLQQCAGRGWRVLLLADDGVPVSVRDVISLVRDLLRARGLGEATVRHGSRSFTVQAGAAEAGPVRRRSAALFHCVSNEDETPAKTGRDAG